ncbi:MAG: DNA repair protein RecO [Lachnospiraceae bacterium]|nr:DNA repair protein RecO [Lachnospiraceae bacterium]
MGQTVIVMGMVLSAMPVNEYDKRITILTKERGKITAFARGARRPGSQFMAATNPFAFGEFELFEGKSSYNLMKTNIQNYFRELTTDYDRVTLGFYFAEFAGYFCQENNDEKEMLKLLYQSLRALCNEHIPVELVRAVFELRAIAVEGQGPNVFSCMNCGKKEELCYFSARRGGVLCRDCGAVLPDPGIPILDVTRYTLQFILATPIPKLYSFTVSPEVLKELKDIMREYLGVYVHHEFKSLKVSVENNL